MTDTEIELRKAIYGLFRVVRMNAYMKLAGKEFEKLLDATDFALAIFEGRPGSEKMESAKNEFEAMAEKVRQNYGTASVSAAYNSFKIALDDEAFLKTLGLTEPMSAQEKSNLFSKAFNSTLGSAENWDEDEDFYSYFIESVKEIIMPTEELPTEKETKCPYCDGETKKVPVSIFFGPHSGKTDGNVWGCDCGAYAKMDEKGNVIGKLGDALLHQKRDLVKGAICELCGLAGLTVFESYRWFSLITGMTIKRIEDVEYLDLPACNIALRLFIVVKNGIKESTADYPKDRTELFMFFAQGGRLMVCNAYGFQCGKLLIPAEVGPEGIRVYGKDGMQSISFSPTLQYEFKGDEMFVVHPSGKREKFRMMPEALREKLFEVREDALLAANAS